MRKLITICLAVGIIIAVSGTVQATLYVETFNSNNANWLSVRTSGATSNVVYQNSGGNPGGYISCSLTNAPLVFGLEPSPVWGGSGGDGKVQELWGNMTGDTLTADFKIDGILTAYNGGTEPMVRFYLGTPGGTYFITTDAYSWNPNNDIGWTTHQVLLLATNFVREAGGESFEDVIAHSNDIGLQFGPSNGEFYTGVGNLGFAGSATLMLDNFGTIPEPTTISILGFGVLSLIGRKK